MYCKYCGQPIDDNADFCISCGRRLDDGAVKNDKSSFGFALLGFLLPLVGLILYFVYDDKRPKRAKSVGKGALIGVITRVVLAIISIVLSFIFAFSVFDAALDGSEGAIPFFGERIEQLMENMEKQAWENSEVSIGEFKESTVSGEITTSLEVTVKNKSDERSTICVTVEALTEDGTRLGTDYVLVERLNPGQSARASAFQYLEPSQIEDFKNASFGVVEITMFEE